MGSSKRHQRASKPPPQTRARTTRSSKGRILSEDPAKTNALLTAQLRSLGLYAAPILGDGNCLFRALSDQLYGTPSHHLQLRSDICGWIELHKGRYEPFCEDERGLGAHLRCMREQGTYGGHLELSAFAHLTQRNVKVIQPGLVYVIEWAAGGAPTAASTSIAASSSTSSTAADPPQEEAGLNEREKRRLRRDQKRAGAGRTPKAPQVADQLDAAPDGDDDDNDDDDDDAGVDPATGAVYVAYHDWEHFSSIRNLRGPHSGLPYVTEMPAESVAPSSPPLKKSSTRTAQNPSLKIKPKAEQKMASKHPPRSKQQQQLASAHLLTLNPPTPSQIPLPNSRSPSPSPLPLSLPIPEPIAVFRADISPPTPYLTQSPPLPLPLPHPIPNLNIRIHKSPKRSFDESSGSSATSSESAAKRSRRLLAAPSTSRGGATMTIDEDLESTPGLSAPGSSTSSSSSSEVASSVGSSPASSPLPTTPPPAVAEALIADEEEGEEEVDVDVVGGKRVQQHKQQQQEPQQRPLTRRQRKAMGLPKSRPVLVAKRLGGTGAGTGGSAGKIVIPGGKYHGRKLRGRVGVRVADDGDDADGVDGDEEEKGEWRTNGTGRVDVRGFRELKI